MTIDALPLDLHTVLLGLFLAFMLGMILCMLREQRKNPLFRTMDLITGDNGRIAQNKYFAAGAFFATSYAFIDGVVTGTDHTSAILAFSGVWASAALINKGLNNMTGSPTSQTVTTTTTAPGESSVTTQVKSNVAG